MNRGLQRLFFLGLPDLKKLVCFSLSLQGDHEEARSRQIRACRELVLLFSDVLASPALDSFTDVTVIMAVSFFQKGIFQEFGQRHHLQLGPPQCVLPGVLQGCLSFTLVSKLAPSWNKAGLYLISGKDFLTESGRLSAVSMELSTSEARLCISIDASTVRLPPTTLQDFDLPPLVLTRFCSDPESVLNSSSDGGAVWCHVLPSMKKGQIISIRRQLPKDGPFRTYRDLQDHWNRLYGYRLPELSEHQVVYCSVYFRLLGDRLFTYPLSCIRLQPVQRCPPVNLQGALGSFVSDIRDRLQTVCGFPVGLSDTPCYSTVSLNTATTVQVLKREEVNVTTSSTRLVLTQLPGLPPPAMKPFFGPQPPAWAPLSQQDQTQGFIQRTEVKTWSSSCLPLPLHHLSAPSLPSSSLSLLQPASSLSSSPLLLQPASSVSSTTASSQVLPPHPLPVNPTPKLVPFFKKKLPSYQHHHSSISPLQVQKQQQSGGVEERWRVPIPTLGKSKPPTAPPSVPLSVPPPCTSLDFSPKPKHVFNPESKCKPRLTVPPKLEFKFKPKSILKPSSSRRRAANCPSTGQEPSACDASNSSTRKIVSFESTLKKSRAKIEDVEKMARSNQLNKLSSATLLAWLKQRGVFVSPRNREELILKVTSCLAEV